MVLRKNTELISHVCVDGNTEIGEETVIYPFAAIGFRPQDLKFHGENSKVIIGKRNSIRESVTIQPGTEGGIMKTVIGDDCLLMANTHVAHDCVVGNHVIMANCATIAGHVTVGDGVVLGGLSAVHQWVRIGQYAMIGGMCGVERDVIPFGIVQGNRASLFGLNVVGLKRRGAKFDEISRLKCLYDKIFIKEGVLMDKLNAVVASELVYESERAVVEFMKKESRRSYCLIENSRELIC